MADPEEARARAALVSMQDRISRGPHNALNVPSNATPQEVRAAFLSLTKQYHPARFGRMSPDVQRLSNEVFLGIRAAHDQLAKAAGTPPTKPGAPPPAAKTPTGGARPLSGPLPTHAAQSSTQMPAMKAPAPQGAPVSGQVRAAQPAPRTGPTPGGQAPTRPSSPAIDPRQPPTRASSPVIVANPPGQATPVAPRPNLSAINPPTSPPRPNLSAINPPTSPPRPNLSAINPPTSQPRPINAASTAQTPDQRDAATAQDMLRRGHWTTARQLLQSLSSRVPTSTQYRALLAYAKGREALAAGRADEAQHELQRALQLDPDLAEARAALAEHVSIKFGPKK